MNKLIKDTVLNSAGIVLLAAIAGFGFSQGVLANQWLNGRWAHWFPDEAAAVLPSNLTLEIVPPELAPQPDVAASERVEG